MCEPATLMAISIGITVASTAATLAQQQQNVEAQEDFQKETHKFNSEVATQNAIRNYTALQRRQVQERQKAAIDIQTVARTSAAAQGTARAQAAESGTAGLSVEALINDFEREELEFQTQTIRTGQFRDAQFRDEAQGVRAGLQGQILSTLPAPVQQPDFIGAGLRIAGSSLNQFTQFRQDQIAAGNTGSVV